MLMFHVKQESALYDTGNGTTRHVHRLFIVSFRALFTFVVAPSQVYCRGFSVHPGSDVYYLKGRKLNTLMFILVYLYFNTSTCIFDWCPCSIIYLESYE